ncbi:hypothetical protein PHYSODRAFT_417221, partial [Phytophthora sojae]
PLVVVDLLFRSKGAFTDLPFVINLVSLFLDLSVELPLHKACQRGSLELLERMWGASEKFVNNFDYNEAWTLRKYIRTDPHYRQFQFTKSLTEATRLKNVEMVTWLAERFQGFTVKESVVTEAARVGSIEILRLFRDYDNSSADPSIRDAGVGLKVEWTSQHALAAAQNGHGRVIWWLQFKCGYIDVRARTAALDAVIINGDIVLAEWLLGHSTPWAQHDGDLHPLHHASATGDLDVLEWIFKNTNFVVYVGLVAVAAAGGHLNVVRWLIDRQVADQPNSPKYTKAAMDGAAGNGHLAVVQWLHQHRSEGCSTSAMDVAATNGHLDVVQWLSANREEGCTTEAMDGAARNGHLLVVDFLHDGLNGCTTRAMDTAASNGHLAVVEWLSDYRFEGCTTDAMDEAAEGGHLDVVKWLHRSRTEGCTVKAMDSAAKQGHLGVVQWLHAHRSEGYSRGAIAGAAEKGNFEVAIFLQSQCRWQCTEDVWFSALESSSPELATWIREH